MYVHCLQAVRASLDVSMCRYMCVYARAHTLIALGICVRVCVSVYVCVLRFLKCMRVYVCVCVCVRVFLIPTLTPEFPPPQHLCVFWPLLYFHPPSHNNPPFFLSSLSEQERGRQQE